MNATPRSVALLLAQLHAGDRRWLLSQLAPEQRRRIGPELEAVLRLPRATRKREAARLGPVALPGVGVSVLAGDSDELAPLIERVDRVDEHRMTTLWRGSPGWLLQSFLAIHPWRTATALQLLLPSMRSAPPAAPSALVRRRLLESVLEALEAGRPLEQAR